MRSKKLLAALLTLCMLVSVLSPAAYAVAPGEDSYLGYVESEKSATNPEKTHPQANDLVVSKDEAESLKNLRDDPINKVEVQNSQSTGAWDFTEYEGDISVDLTVAETPDCLDELRKASEVYANSDRVVAFVVMEQAPVAELYSNGGVASSALEQQMLLQQDGVIDTIEEEILDGEELDVRYQFTYLTNSFSVVTEFGNLEQIAQIESVKSVYLMPVYTPCNTEDTAVPYTTASGELVGAPNVWADYGYSGTGMRIAIIDTGLDLDHPSFAAAPAANEYSMTVEDIAAVLTDLNAYAMRGSITAEALYRSAKVPYAFNYVDRSLTADHSSDMAGDHGTHVAGIAAANPVDGSGVVGMAPDAQIIVMKVFGANGGAYGDDILAALEDAMTLDCDVVNLSLGSPAGFSSMDPEIDAIYARISEQDIIVAIAAGNEGTSSYGNMWGTDLNTTEHPDNSTISSPATYMNATSVASADNIGVMHSFLTVGENDIPYNEGIGLYVTMAEVLGGQEVEYVVIPGLGEAADFEGIDVEGKVALIQRGVISFAQKVANAEALGAVGVVIYNNTDESIENFGMSFRNEDDSLADGVSGYVPAVMVELAAGELMAAAETKTLTVSPKEGLFAANGGGQMSEFSSWGASPDLRLVPDITGIGGNVYSCYDGGMYGLMSGTSMACPQVAGVSALVMEYIRDKFPGLSDAEVHALAEALLMSTATPIISTASGVEASPRQQGSGLVNALGAVTTDAYLTVGGEKPKAELFDGNGDYSFTFEVHNLGSESKTYTLSSSLLTEDCLNYGIGVYFMAGYDCALPGTVTFSTGDSVTVAAGATATVTVNVSVSAEGKAWLDYCYPNGGYVEGYVYLKDADAEGVDLNLPFMGFYGDWTEPDLFDSAYWYENTFWDLYPAEGFADGNEFWHVVWTDLQGMDWVLGMNPYSGVYTDENGNIAYDPAHNVVSPNGDGAVDGIADMYVSLMRNARTLTFSYSIDGEVVYEQVSDFVNKTMYISTQGQVIPYVHSWYYYGTYDFTDTNGDPLPNGTEVLLTITGKLDYADGGEHSITIPITVDTEAPVLENTQQRVEGDACYLDVYCNDNVALAAAIVMNNTGTRILAEAYEFVDVGGYYKATFDVTGLGTEFVLAVTDYACNEAFYELTFDEGGENAPVMDQSLLYAYRVFDQDIYSDYMFGWVNINKETAEVVAETSDYMEYYAMVAAEYAGGYIFAVDAGNNLMYLVPGIWNRNQICTLDYAVIDMAFDEVNQVMYVMTKTESSDGLLQTLDLLTGELTPVADFGYYYYGPWAITCDDEGTLYAVVQNKSNLFTVTWEDGVGELTPVTNADGEEIQILDSYGSPVNPNHSQSMTYSKADNKIYWAYFTSGWMGDVADLISIDMTDYSSTATVFAAISEYVGVLNLEDDGFEIPEAISLQSVWLSSDRLVLNVGATDSNKLNAIPWNYTLGDVTWSSSDPSVATVENGVITGIAKGNAVITATSEGMSAECLVTVVDVSGDLYAYDYINNSDDFMDLVQVDLESMTMESLWYAPVDILAGDYNGHDGYIYGYAEGGQFLKADPATGDVEFVGAPIGTVPADMAYDYTTGTMYAVTVDFNMYCSVLWAVNMNNGQLHQIALIDGLLLTLACDAEGNLFGVTYWGDFSQILIEDGIGFCMPYFSNLGDLQYMQSMCYDHTNNVFLWACPEHGTLYWLDPYNEAPYMISLGDPTGSGLFEFTCLYTIPETIPELPYVAVEDAYAEDMIVLVGQTKAPNVTVLPLNATNRAIDWTSSDESVVTVDENGNLVGVAKGEATISGVLNDNGTEFALEFGVTVLKGAENLYGHILTDVATYDGQFWARLYPENPGAPEGLEYSDYIIYAEEYYNGKLYAYGYDPNDWEANWQYFVLDPVSYEIESMTDLGEGVPFIYDMTYDYNSSTMYCTAGASSDDANLYIIDVETGKLLPCMTTENFYMSLAAGKDGKLYGMVNSREEFDPFSWATTYTDAELYLIDPVAKTETLIGYTGVKCNMLASMTYDYENDWLYWSPFFQGDSVSGGLTLVNPETAEAYVLGNIGTAGAQVSGLYTVSEYFPEEPDPVLSSLLVDPANLTIYVGAEPTAISVYALPLSLEGVNYTWSSSDESIATVEDGMVTPVSQGAVVITITAEHNGVTLTTQCNVAVLREDAALLSYNVTDNTWAYISRKDVSVVTNLDIAYTGEVAALSDESVTISAFAAMDGYVYGYDSNNNFFRMDAQSSAVEIIGNANVAVDAENDEAFEVRGMAYDEANDRLLVLGALYGAAYHDELYDGCRLYTVNMATGELTEILVFSDFVYVKALAVDEAGTVYVYSTFDDYITKVDLETGTTTAVVSLQTQSVYGDSEFAQTLYYDSLTKQLFLMVTGNGSFYRFFTIDPVTGALAEKDRIGEVVYNPDTWVYDGDTFVGLADITVVPPHDHELQGDIAFQWSEDHSSCTAVFVCGICGENRVACDVTVTETANTCTEDGSKVYVATAVVNGETVTDTFTEVIPAAGHTTHVEGLVLPTCGEEGYSGDVICDICGAVVEEGTVMPATGEHEMGQWETTKEPTDTEPGEQTRKCNNCDHTETRSISVDEEEPPVVIPPTGDNFDLTLILVLLGVSLLAIVVLLAFKFRKPKK